MLCIFFKWVDLKHFMFALRLINIRGYLIWARCLKGASEFEGFVLPRHSNWSSESTWSRRGSKRNRMTEGGSQDFPSWLQRGPISLLYTPCEHSSSVKQRWGISAEEMRRRFSRNVWTLWISIQEGVQGENKVYSGLKLLLWATWRGQFRFNIARLELNYELFLFVSSALTVTRNKILLVIYCIILYYLVKIK